jgi:hypothetical protein
MHKLIAIAAVVGILSPAGANVANPYGNLDTPRPPRYLTGSDVRLPWGNRTVHQFDDLPTTEITRKYDFAISRGTANPDGFQKDVIAINGQTPGPLIEANWGDWIEGIYCPQVIRYLKSSPSRRLTISDLSNCAQQHHRY